VGRYAVHCSGIAFSCKKYGDSGVSVSTSANSNTTDRIRQIYGSTVAGELINFSIDDQNLGFRASGLATNANYHAKRVTILLFINHRSVDSSAIRRAVEQTYSGFLPKGGHPFIYLDLEIEPQRVDVNVHPTKREVNFLNEDEIIDSICVAIRKKLATVDSSRTFMTQTLLTGTPNSDIADRAAGAVPSTEDGRSVPRTPASTKRPYENSLVRTDAKMRKITSMLPSTASQPRPDLDSRVQSPIGDGVHYESGGGEPVQIRLTSVKTLRAAVRSAMHNNLTEIFASHTYVGLVDERRRISAIQSGVKLFLVDYGMVCSEFFYQIGLTNFGNFGSIKLESSPNLVDLLSLAAAVEREEYRRRNPAPPASGDGGEPDTDEIIPKEVEEVDFNQVVSAVAAQLIDRREMLKEYFSLSISVEGNLLSIPLLLKGYMPSLAKLPRFLLRLGPYVDWTSEEACFRTFLRELASFYTPEQLPTPPPAPGKRGDDVRSRTPNDIQPEKATERGGGNDDERSGAENSGNLAFPEKPGYSREEDETISRRRHQLSWMLEHVLFPALRARLVATNDLVRGVVEVADLKGLYRVFERC
jgi:DNA mismatch repair protein MLH1